MPDDVFGNLVTGTDVEAAALSTLKLWAPAYMAWAERSTDRAPGSLPAPRSWVTASGVERWPEEQLPSVLLVSTGLAEPPSLDGSGSYRGTFALGLAVVVAARDRADADALAKLYVATLGAILLHKPSLGGLAAGVEWTDEKYDALPGDPAKRRQLAAGQAVYTVDVRDIRSGRGAGPLTPPDDPQAPAPDDPTVTSAELEIDPRGVS